MTDGVFSMGGDIANLPEICRLAKKYGARVMVDDAHGLGVLGEGGRGTASYYGLEEEVDIYMGTFSKSLASLDGYMAASDRVADYVRHNSRPFIFSASIPPANCAAALADAKHQFDVNFFGMVNMNHAVLPIMRRQCGGRIINLSSVAGSIPIPFQTYYSATKAAINAYTMALANEVKPFGIEVCCVQPGDICTGFTAAREKLHDGDDVYGGRISHSVAGMEHDEQSGMSPEAAGAFICRVAAKKRVKPVNTIGFSYQIFCVLAKLMPAKLLNALVGKLYGGWRNRT